MNMITKNTNKILLFLLKDLSVIGYNINQIAKETKISLGSAFKILKELEKKNIINKKNISNGSYYKINFNFESQILFELILINERKNQENKIKIYINEISKYIDSELILLFGSILKNENYNDVDVMFITDNTKKVLDFCLNISKIRTKPIVPFILKKEDLIEELKKQNQTIINIIKNSIIIKGEKKFLEVIQNVQQ
jgi:predicted nucleotidyltransferase